MQRGISAFSHIAEVIYALFLLLILIADFGKTSYSGIVEIFCNYEVFFWECDKISVIF